jgi:hypothetical protein
MISPRAVTDGCTARFADGKLLRMPDNYVRSSLLLAAQPTVINPDDAKWMLDDPRAVRWASIIPAFRLS